MCLIFPCRTQECLWSNIMQHGLMNKATPWHTVGLPTPCAGTWLTLSATEWAGCLGPTRASWCSQLCCNLVASFPGSTTNTRRDHDLERVEGCCKYVIKRKPKKMWSHCSVGWRARNRPVQSRLTALCPHAFHVAELSSAVWACEVLSTGKGEWIESMQTIWKYVCPCSKKKYIQRGAGLMSLQGCSVSPWEDWWLEGSTLDCHT